MDDPKPKKFFLAFSSKKTSFMKKLPQALSKLGITNRRPKISPPILMGYRDIEEKENFLTNSSGLLKSRYVFNF